jgi:hypothetical protein
MMNFVKLQISACFTPLAKSLYKQVRARPYLGNNVRLSTLRGKKYEYI